MNRDDDFFKLPRARAKRGAPTAEPAPPTGPTNAVESSKAAPVAPKTAAEPTPGDVRVPPIISTTPASAALTAPQSEPVASRTADSVPQATPVRTMPAAAAVGTPPPEVARPLKKEPPPPPPPHAPSGSRGLWLWPVFGVGVIGLVIVGGLFGYWVFMNVAARLYLSNQPLTIQLPKETELTLRTKNNVDILMKGTIYAQVPLKQTLDLPIKGTYDTIVDIDTRVPLETIITYEGVIPIDTMADIEAKAPVNFQNVKKYKNLYFKAKLPMKLSLPVKLVVPVKQDIVLKYHGPLRVGIDHVIRAPVNTTLNTALKVNQEFSVPITSSLRARLQLPQHPVKATIVESDLNLDISTLRLERKPAEPAR